ncbi:MAG: tetratricopeptide repeat protein [Gemmatimonadota bacterium]|nr:MAG: tetratricopeptide repeat protein [Gemmatimonadota bacterium]
MRATQFLFVGLYLAGLPASFVNGGAGQQAATQPRAPWEPSSAQGTLLSQESRIAVLVTKVDMLQEQIRLSGEQRAADYERAATRTTWIVSLGALFVTAILTIFGWFVSTRLREPEEYREKMRERFDAELATARQAVHDVKQEASSAVQTTLRAQEEKITALLEEQRRKIQELYGTATRETEEFEQRNARTLQQIRDLIEIGAGEAPGEEPDADALYFMAERVSDDDPKVRRAKAVRYLRRLVDPSIGANAVVLHNAGVMARNYEAGQLAIDLIARAVEESGGSPEFESSYAHELALVRRADEARAIFDRLLAEHPNDEYVGKRYIDAMRALGEHDRINDYVASHGELLDESAMVLSEYGDYLLGRRRLDEAEKVLERAIELDPGDDLTWGYLGRLRMIAGDLPRAQEAFESGIRTATEASPRLPSHFQRLGDVFMAMEKPERAQWAYTASLIADQVPGRAQKWLHILESRRKLGVPEPVSETREDPGNDC